MRLPFSLDGDHALLAVRLTPRARKDGLAGLVDTGEGRFALAVRVAAPPVEGAANKALIALLARKLGVARSAVAIASGETSRLKMVRIENASAAELEALF
jgi:uncharacterized protein (TIGR00251 family)